MKVLATCKTCGYELPDTIRGTLPLGLIRCKKCGECNFRLDDALKEVYQRESCIQ